MRYLAMVRRAMLMPRSEKILMISSSEYGLRLSSCSTSSRNASLMLWLETICPEVWLR
ncbi:MAG: hypothetical protein R3F23_07550 [Verrucomicrobiia bacterium]